MVLLLRRIYFSKKEKKNFNETETSMGMFHPTNSLAVTRNWWLILQSKI
jgi:hypothetical protein